MTTEARLTRIESILERITEAHLELETAQINAQKAHTRFIDDTRRGDLVDDREAQRWITHL